MSPHHIQMVKNETQPNHPSPHSSHPQTQDKHNSELPSPKLKLHVTSTNDRGKKNRNVKCANSNPQVHILFKNQDQKKIFLNACSICPYFQQFYIQV